VSQRKTRADGLCFFFLSTLEPGPFLSSAGSLTLLAAAMAPVGQPAEPMAPDPSGGGSMRAEVPEPCWGPDAQLH